MCLSCSAKETAKDSDFGEALGIADLGDTGMDDLGLGYQPPESVNHSPGVSEDGGAVDEEALQCKCLKSLSAKSVEAKSEY